LEVSRSWNKKYNILTLQVEKCNVKKNTVLTNTLQNEKEKNVRKANISVGLIKALKKLYRCGRPGFVPGYQACKLKRKGYWHAYITEKGKVFLGIKKNPNLFLTKTKKIPSRFENRVKQFITGTGGW